MEEIKRKFIETMKEKNASYNPVPDEVIEALVNDVFSNIKSKDSYLDLNAFEAIARERYEKENKLNDKEYYRLDSYFAHTLDEYKDEMIAQGIIRKNLTIDDDFKGEYSKAEDNLKNYEKCVKELLQVRKNIVKTMKDKNLSDEEKLSIVNSYKDNAKYHEIYKDNPQEARAMDLMYASNESLVEILTLKDLTPEEAESRKQSYEEALNKLIVSGYVDKENDLLSISRDIDEILNEKNEEQIKIEASKVWSEVGWKAHSGNPDPRQLEEEKCFENNMTREEYIKSMIGFEKNTDDELVKINEELDNIKEEIKEVENDDTLTDEEKNKKLQELQDKQDEKKQLLDDKVKDLTDEYSKRYDKIQPVYSKMKKFVDGHEEFYKGTQNLETQNQRYYDNNLKKVLDQVPLNKATKEPVDLSKNGDDEADKAGKNTKDSTPKGKEKDTKGGNTVQGEGTATEPESKPKKALAIVDPGMALDEINKFVNMSVYDQARYLENKGYETLMNATDVLNKNKDNKGYKFPRALRKKLSETIEKNVECDVYNAIESKVMDKDGMIKMLGKLSTDPEEMYKKLYYVTKNKEWTPKITKGKISKETYKELSSMILKYDSMIENGEISEADMKLIDRYLIEPVCAGAIQRNLSTRTISGKIRNAITKEDERFSRLNNRISKVSQTKAEQDEFKENMQHGSYNTDDAARNQQTRENSRGNTGRQQQQTRTRD